MDIGLYESASTGNAWPSSLRESLPFGAPPGCPAVPFSPPKESGEALLETKWNEAEQSLFSAGRNIFWWPIPAVKLDLTISQRAVKMVYKLGAAGAGDHFSSLPQVFGLIHSCGISLIHISRKSESSLPEKSLFRRPSCIFISRNWSRILRLWRMIAKISIDRAGPRRVMHRFVNSSMSTRWSPSTSKLTKRVQASDALISAVSKKACIPSFSNIISNSAKVNWPSPSSSFWKISAIICLNSWRLSKRFSWSCSADLIAELQKTPVLSGRCDGVLLLNFFRNYSQSKCFWYSIRLTNHPKIEGINGQAAWHSKRQRCRMPGLLDSKQKDGRQSGTVLWFKRHIGQTKKQAHACGKSLCHKLSTCARWIINPLQHASLHLIRPRKAI